MIRKKRVKISLEFECWALPSKEFISEFKKTFDLKNSRIIISPETGSERVRKINKGYYYSNEDLLSTLELLRDVKVQLYFTFGLSGETWDNLRDTLYLEKDILTRFDNVSAVAFAIDIEPGAPWSINPEKYGIFPERESFDDYYRAHQFKSNIGYHTKELSSKQILHGVNLINRLNARIIEKRINKN